MIKVHEVTLALEDWHGLRERLRDNLGARGSSRLLRSHLPATRLPPRGALRPSNRDNSDRAIHTRDAGRASRSRPCAWPLFDFKAHPADHVLPIPVRESRANDFMVALCTEYGLRDHAQRIRAGDWMGRYGHGGLAQRKVRKRTSQA